MSRYKRWPIGIQSGPSGDPRGIGEVIDKLTQDDIAMFSASSDSMSILFDLQYARKQTGVPHTGNYSVHGYEDDIHLQVPVYGQPHSRALAKQHWDLVEKRGLPPEIDWDMPCIWVSTWNEVRPYVGWAEAGSGSAPEDQVAGYEGNADLIGWQAVEIGLEAMARGYRWAAFGFAGGNPEPDFWLAPGVVEYLRLCHKYPDQLGIALHEYALGDTLVGDNKIGYFQHLHRACDQLGLRRPVIQIKEFGWQARSVPAPEVAIPELIQAANIYMKHPNIHGAAIWTAQKHHRRQWGNVFEVVKKIIPPLGQAALQHALPIPDLPEPNLPDVEVTPSTPTPSANGEFAFSHWPAESFRISQGYNARPEVYGRFCWNGRCLTGHDGVDIAAPYGSPIYAVAAGKVSRLRQADDADNNYGNAVYITHRAGYQTVYAHLKDTNVALNEEVEGGHLIGWAGNTGNVRPRPTPSNPTAGSHLHLTLKKKGATEQGETEQPFDIIDPMPFLESFN